MSERKIFGQNERKTLRLKVLAAKHASSNVGSCFYLGSLVSMVTNRNVSMNVLITQGLHDTQHYDIQHTDTQHYDIQHTDTQHKGLFVIKA
jgi:hypothetical protein